MDKYPQMLYRAPGNEQHHGVNVETREVGSDEDFASAQAEGFFETTTEAKDAYQEKLNEQAKPKANQKPIENHLDDDGPPTRYELEQKAKELGIEFKPNITDQNLADRIERKLAGTSGPK